MADILLDTGAWVAIIDQDERAHHRCLDAFRELAGRLVSTEAVLSETLWFMQNHKGGARACAEFVRRGAVALLPISVESLSRAVDLMEKYRNVPMDFADATLVTLGEDLGLDRVFTLDHRGFGVYRLHGRRPFHIIP